MGTVTKRILVIIDRRWVSKVVTKELASHLEEFGFETTVLHTAQAPKPVEIIQLDKLNSGQYRRLINKINKIKEETDRTHVTG